MDGLECKEIMRSELERTIRIDSEFYIKSAIHISEMLQIKPHNSLTTYVNVSDGNHMGISEHFSDEGVPYYRGQDAGTFFIENSNPVCIDEKTFALPVMKRSHLKKGDVLLSIVGTIGSLSLVYSDRNATCSCKLAILRPNDNKNSELLATFLSCKYGQAQIARFTRGAVQKGLILEDMDQLIVPIFGDRVIEAINNTIQGAYQLQEKAEICYHDAERNLLSSLNIQIKDQTIPVIAEKSFTESFMRTGRLDAESYQPKYELIQNDLNTDETVLSLCNIYDKPFIPDKASSYSYIENSTATFVHKQAKKVANYISTFSNQLRKHNSDISGLWGKIERNIIGLIDNDFATLPENLPALLEYIKTLLGLKDATRNAHDGMESMKGSLQKIVGIERSLNQAIRFLENDLTDFLSVADQICASIDRIQAKSRYLKA